MQLKYGETRTPGYKNEMLLEDGKTQTRGCKNLEIKNYMYPTPPRLGSISSRFVSPCSLPHIIQDHCVRLVFFKSRMLRILLYRPTQFLLFWNSLYVYAQGILGCLLGFWPLGQNSTGATTVVCPQTLSDVLSSSCIMLTVGNLKSLNAKG